jgi:hypothetical protein
VGVVFNQRPATVQLGDTPIRVSNGRLSPEKTIPHFFRSGYTFEHQKTKIR